MQNNLFDWIPMPWDKRLERARSRGYFSQQEVTIARSWNSCAIGERRAQYQWPIETFFREKADKRDLAHTDLGIAFFRAIQTNDVEKAITVYSIIQQTFPIKDRTAPTPKEKETVEV